MKHIILLLLFLILPSTALAHDHGRTDQAWEALSQEEKNWYKSLMRPDMPEYPCCGESDQYWCDIVTVEKHKDGDKVFCTITDTRPDEPFKRIHVPVGTKIEIPPEKYKFDQGNPTGHTIVFLSSTRSVYCFVQSTGI
jgi:hypothetical protein